jgi:hypothetical protein
MIGENGGDGQGADSIQRRLVRETALVRVPCFFWGWREAHSITVIRRN